MKSEKVREDYFRIEIGWEEIYGNGDTYDESKVLVLRAIDEKAAIRKLKTWWKKKNVYAADDFKILSVEQFSSSQIEMSLAIDPLVHRVIKWAMIRFEDGKCKLENVFESESIAEGEAIERNIEDAKEGVWYFVKPVV